MNDAPSGLKILSRLLVVFLVAAVFVYGMDVPYRYFRLARFGAIRGMNIEWGVAYVGIWALFAFWVPWPWPERPQSTWGRRLLIGVVAAIGAVVALWFGLIAAWIFASHFPNLGRTLVGKTK